ncbi:MAG: heparin lyase I family protein [Thermoleophilia bacterium]
MQRVHLVLLCVLTTAFALASSAAGAISFRADWEKAETGTQPPAPWEALEYGGQFDGSPSISSQLEIVTSPVRQGSRAARFTVHPGDRYGGSSGERSLARWIGSNERDGQEHYYGWSTLFPTDWVEASGWQIITEFHADRRFPLAPLRFDAKRNSLELWMTTGACPGPYDCAIDRGRTILRDLHKGEWNDFILHVVWRESATGMVEVWHRVEGETGFRRIARIPNVPTLPSRRGEEGAELYLLHGLYRDDASITQSVFHDNFVRGDTYEDVAKTFPGGLADAQPSGSGQAEGRGAEGGPPRPVAFERRPTLVGPATIAVRARAAAGALVAITAYNARGKLVGATTATANSKGAVRATVKLDARPTKRVVVVLAVDTANGVKRASWSADPPRRRK